MNNDIIALSPNHRRFVTLYLSGQYGINKIAELLDVHPNTIRKWMKRDDVSTYLQEMQDEQNQIIKMQLSQMTTKAANKLSDLVDSNIDGVALQAVKDILDRGGYKAEQKVKKEVTITTYEQQIDSIVDATMSDVIDVEYIEEQMLTER